MKPSEKQVLLTPDEFVFNSWATVGGFLWLWNELTYSVGWLVVHKSDGQSEEFLVVLTLKSFWFYGSVHSGVQELLTWKKLKKIDFVWTCHVNKFYTAALG